MHFLKRVPLEISSLALAFASYGNFLEPHSKILQYIFGLISFFLILLLFGMLIKESYKMKSHFKDVHSLTTLPTLFMCISTLSIYVAPFNYNFALSIWIFALISHLVLIFIFILKSLKSFSILDLLPAYLPVFVGIGAASISSPTFNMQFIGKIIFFVGFTFYLLLLPMILYRILILKKLSKSEIPTITLFLAPINLLLSSYLTAFTEINLIILFILFFFAFTTLLIILYLLPLLLGLTFSPKFSSYAFSTAITSSALTKTHSFLINKNILTLDLSLFLYLLSSLSLMIILFVTVKYLKLIFYPYF